jgi:hypothetical protein
MSTLRQLVLVGSLLCSLGCSGSTKVAGIPGDPKAAEVLRAHWDALQRREWRAAHDRLHPDLKAKFSLKQFTDFHSRRLKQAGVPKEIRVEECETVGDDVVVFYDVLFAPPGGGEAVLIPPRRKATLRKSGESWGLLTHDLLVVVQ